VDRGGLYFALTVVALLIAIYLVFQLIGFVFKLLFFVAVVLIAVAAVRAWRGSS
jgi:Na+-transporting methylmalonyl-CoA/oxaloacetate decarboxylase gamma subunit